jgi:hypothetical protein
VVGADPGARLRLLRPLGAAFRHGRWRASCR